MKNDRPADLLNLDICAKSIAKLLGPTPHLLTDMFGNTISSLSPEKAGSTSVDIILGERASAKLKAPSGQIEQVKGLLETTIEAFLKAEGAEETAEQAELVARDIESLIKLTESDLTPIRDQLFQFLRIVRAHSWVEKASVFVMLDGFSLDGVASIGWNGDGWKTLLTNVAGAVATSRQPYIVQNPASDKNLQGRSGVEEIKNLACYPIIHGTTLLGVLILTNRFGGPFDPAAKETPWERFLHVAANMIQKHSLRSRMEDFERTNDHLGKYLSKKIVKNVEVTGEIHLGGIEKKVVCLFSDIRGYTSITEGLSPATLVKLLNFHFEYMHAIIEKNEGTLDKIVGDLIMAVWNIPKDQPEPELLAMKTAMEMQKEMLRVVIPEWKKHGVEKVGMGVGVNSGLAVAGNLGSTRFMNYTVIGDAVNTAQRLEAKAQAGEIWMNEDMYSAIEGKLEKPLRREINIRLKGKEQTINALVYKPLQQY